MGWDNPENVIKEISPLPFGIGDFMPPPFMGGSGQSDIGDRLIKHPRRK
jgi:hypothetical protein